MLLQVIYKYLIIKFIQHTTGFLARIIRQENKSKFPNWKLNSISHVWLFVTPCIYTLPGSSVHGKDTGVGCHFLLHLFRQGYWSRLPFPSPGDLPDPGIKSRSPALQAESLLSDSLGKPYPNWKCRSKIACVDNGILYTENLKYYIKKTCYINQSIRKIAGYKKVYNNILHCHTNNILLEREIKEKIRMIVASKRIIYLGINLTRAEISVY